MNNEKTHAIQFKFEEEEEEEEKEKKIEGKPKSKKSTKVKEKNKNYVMRTVSGGQIKVEELKTYSVKIIKAYVHEGIEYCTMVIEGFENEECNWVTYKSFRFV